MARKKQEEVEVAVVKPDYSKAIEGLKQKWFKLALREKLGKTKFITNRLDALEKEIKELQAK